LCASLQEAHTCTVIFYNFKVGMCSGGGRQQFQPAVSLSELIVPLEIVLGHFSYSIILSKVANYNLLNLGLCNYSEIQDKVFYLPWILI
jgi:hypothetical protein